MTIDIYSRANQVAFAAGLAVTGLAGLYLTSRKCKSIDGKIEEQVAAVKAKGYDSLFEDPKKK